MYIIIGADGQQYGPVTSDQLRGWIAEGRANGQTMVRAADSAEWRPLSELHEFALLLSTAKPVLASAPPPFPVTRPARTNQMAIAGMVLGILSITAGCCCYGLPFNVIGVICSALALSEISKDPLAQQGKGLAIAGLVLSILSILLVVLMLVFSLSGSELLRRLNRL